LKCVFAPVATINDRTLSFLSIFSKTGAFLGYVEFMHGECFGALQGYLNDPRSRCTDQSKNNNLSFQSPIFSDGSLKATLRTESLAQCREARMLLQAWYQSRTEVRLPIECSDAPPESVVVTGYGSYLRITNNADLLAEIGWETPAECVTFAPNLYSFAAAKKLSLSCASSSSQGKLALHSSFKLTDYVQQFAYFQTGADCSEMTALIQKQTGHSVIDHCSKN
jgi:hypothetical protein